MCSSLLPNGAQHQTSDGTLVRLTSANAQGRAGGRGRRPRAPRTLRAPSPRLAVPPPAAPCDDLAMSTTPGLPVDPGAAAHDGPHTPGTAIDPYHQGVVTGPTTDHPATLTTATGFRFLDAAIDKAVAIPSSVIRQHVGRLRERNPHASPAQIIALLERQFLLAVGASGGAVGAAAAAPAVGTGVAVALTTSEVAAFFAASAAFSLAVAEVHGIAVED